jgi:hypothetical protein
VINYTYLINSMTCSQLDATKPDLVVAIQINMMAVDTTDNLTAMMTTVLQFKPTDVFIPFNELTKEVVDSWIAPHPRIPELKKDLENLIVAKLKPPYIERKAPWLAPLIPGVDTSGGVNTIPTAL